MIRPKRAVSVKCTTMWCMKSEVYSWRVSTDLKSTLEREARVRKTSISSVLDPAVREWLKASHANPVDDNEQRQLHQAAARCPGIIDGGDPPPAEPGRSSLRQRR